jgi:thioester reductase-like protein
MREDLGLTDKQRQDLVKDLNVIINCAACLDLEARIEISLRANVGGPLKLLKLAEECPKMLCFLQVSSAFVNSDRTGFLEERIYESTHNWSEDYQRVLTMPARDLKANAKKILGSFPNAYVYSKRMAEHMLILNNSKNIPLVLLRPSAIGTAANEPMPGWTDSLGLVLGASLVVGLGVLRDMRGNG